MRIGNRDIGPAHATYIIAELGVNHDGDPRRALELVRARAELLANRTIKDFGNGIQILNGRYGPYITDGDKNARIPKDREPPSLSEAECVELLAAAPFRPKRGFGKGAKGKAASKKASAKTTATKAPAKKAAAKKAGVKKSAAKKAPGKKQPERKSAAKKAVKKAPSARKPVETAGASEG